MSSHIAIAAGDTAELALARLNWDLDKLAAEHRMVETVFKAVFDLSKEPMALDTHWFPEGTLKESDVDPEETGLYSLESLEIPIRMRMALIFSAYPALTQAKFVAIGRVCS